MELVSFVRATMSSLFVSKSRLNVYLSKHPDQTHDLERLPSSIMENGDRDVVVDSGSVSQFKQQEMWTLLSINKLLAQAGHQLALQSTTPELEALSAQMGIAQDFRYAHDRDAELNGVGSYH